jgi:hypothetical protein
MKTLRTISTPPKTTEYTVVGIGLRRPIDRHGIDPTGVFLVAEFAQVGNDREIPGTRQTVSVPYEAVRFRSVTVAGKDVTLAQWAAIGLEIAAAMDAKLITAPPESVQ